MTAALEETRPRETLSRPEAAPTKQKRVVIIGGGFAGIAAARALRRCDAEVILIDRRNHHIFQPLLYQVTTAVLAPAEIAAPIRQIEETQQNLTVMLAEVTAVDLSSRSVTVSYPASGAHKITFDFLIIAAGMQSSYFGHDEFARYAPGLKNLSDAERIRTKILDAYELAELTDDESERSRLMTFVLVGGGATGVELAASMAQMAAVTLRGNFRRTDPANTSIVLIEGGSRILPCARIGSARYTDRARWRLDARPGLCREPLPLP
jgi:NADH dehydrogenase